MLYGELFLPKSYSVQDVCAQNYELYNEVQYMQHF